MYARVTTFQGDPEKIAGITPRLDQIRKQISGITGIACIYTAWRSDGSGIATAIYYNEAAAILAGPQVQEIWADLADILVAPPLVEIFDNVADLSS